MLLRLAALAAVGAGSVAAAGGDVPLMLPAALALAALGGFPAALYRDLRSVDFVGLLSRALVVGSSSAALLLVLARDPALAWKFFPAAFGCLVGLGWCFRALEHRGRRPRIAVAGGASRDRLLALLRRPELRVFVLGTPLHAPEELAREAARRRLDRLLLAGSEAEEEGLVLRLLAALSPTVQVQLVPTALQSLLGSRRASRRLGDLRLLSLASPLEDPLVANLRQLGDLVGALVLLVLTAPLLLSVWVALLLTGRGVLYRQARLGRGGTEFWMLKFRTMHETPDADARIAAPGDARVTRLGAWLRPLHLDELPQLFNVLRGEMSLIGPRPDMPLLLPKAVRALPGYGLRHRVKPGITGLAQVSARYDSAPLEKLRFDLAFMYGWSFRLELEILLLTVLRVFHLRL